MKTSLVVTTINSANEAMKSLAAGAKKSGWDFIVIGDKKGPESYEIDGVDFFSFDDQQSLDLEYASICPVGHYARKNIGYLISMSRNSDIIVETDDDNHPMEAFFSERNRTYKGYTSKGGQWINIYQYFHDSNIWPRGFPLNKVRNEKIPLPTEMAEISSPIQQGLADQDPDVDAIYRLLFDLPISFTDGPNIALARDQFCPFNSQNTTFFKESFPLLYIPSQCTWRVADIWRGFVATRVAHAHKWPVTFHQPTVYQVRNTHDLMVDFKEEQAGYLGNEQLINQLSSLALDEHVDAIYDNLHQCYELMTNEGFVGKMELRLVEAWISDCQKIQTTS